MKISVIILSYNRIQDTLELLASLKKQIFQDYEIILVDNNSTDDTVKTVKETYPDVKCLALDYNAGVPGGRNHGMRQANGDFLVFIDNDAEVKPDFLIAVDQKFRMQSDAGILAFKILNYFTKDIDLTSWVWNDDLLDNPQFKPVHKFVGCGYAIRKEVMEQVGLMWDDLFFMHEEKDYSMRLLTTRYLVYYTPEIEVFHKVSPERRYESDERSFYYGIRNEFWIYIRNIPLKIAVKHLLYLAFSAGIYAIKKRCFNYYIRGMYEGIFRSKKAWQLRKALTIQQIRRFNQLENSRKDSIKIRIMKFFSS